MGSDRGLDPRAVAYVPPQKIHIAPPPREPPPRWPMPGEEGNADYQACKEEFNLVQEYLLSEMVRSYKAVVNNRCDRIREAIHPPILQSWTKKQQKRLAR